MVFGKNSVSDSLLSMEEIEKDKIKKALMEVFQIELSPSEIGDDEVLFSQPLSSISERLLELIDKLEEEFDIKIKDEDLRAELFLSVKAMVNYIKGKKVSE